MSDCLAMRAIISKRVDRLVSDTDRSDSLLQYRTALVLEAMSDLLETTFIRMCELRDEVDELKKEKCYVD